MLLVLVSSWSRWVVRFLAVATCATAVAGSASAFAVSADGAHASDRAPSADVSGSPDPCGRFGVETVVASSFDTKNVAWAPPIATAGCKAARFQMQNPNAAPVLARYEAARAGVESAKPPAPGPVEAPVVTIHPEMPSLPSLQPPTTPSLSLPGADVPHLPESATHDSAPLLPPSAPRSAEFGGAETFGTEPGSAGPSGTAPIDEVVALPTHESSPALETVETSEPYAPATTGARGAAGPLQEATRVGLVRTVAAGAAMTLLLWGAVGLYHRHASSEQLDHPGRRALYDAVVSAPGLRLADLARATGIHPKTARYHLDSLLTARLVARDATGGFRPPGHAPVATLSDRVLEAVAAQPGIHVSDLARQLGVSKACAQGHVTDLLIVGALESRAEHGMRRLFAPVEFAVA